MSSTKQLKTIIIGSNQNSVSRIPITKNVKKDWNFFSPINTAQQALQEYYPQQQQTDTQNNQKSINTNRSNEQNSQRSNLQQIYTYRPSMKWMQDKKSCNFNQDNRAYSKLKNQNNNNVKLKKILNQTISVSRNPQKIEVLSMDDEIYKKQKKALKEPTNKTINTVTSKNLQTVQTLSTNEIQTSQIMKQKTQMNAKNKIMISGNLSERVTQKPSTYLNIPNQQYPRKNTQQQQKNSFSQLTKQLSNPIQLSPNLRVQTQISPKIQSESRSPNLIIQTIEKKKNYREDLPLDAQTVLINYVCFLTEYEQKEILDYKHIFYFGQNSKKIVPNNDELLNFGYDNDRGDYLWSMNDQVAYRYEILDKLGKGSFGQTLLVYDHKRKCKGALKIIRNKKKFHTQALIEIQVLKLIRERDSNPQSSSLIKIKDYFLFRNHVCILFELLSMNLYEFLRQTRFVGVTLDLIRRFAIQLLQALLFLEQHHIIHCDLKPENILLKESNKSGIKIIDFGSSCFEDERIYSYIQSRFYRAPEIILGMQYGLPIDMWSFGCIMCELYTGTPLFASENERDHISMLFEIISLPPHDMLNQCSKKLLYFANDLTPIMKANSKGKIRQIGTKPLANVLLYSSENFVNFVQGCLKWSPNERMRPAEALVHEWILEGLPASIKEQHLIQMKECAPYLPIFQDKQSQLERFMFEQPQRTFTQQNQEQLTQSTESLSKLEQNTLNLNLSQKQQQQQNEDQDTGSIILSPNVKQGIQGEAIKKPNLLHQLSVIKNINQNLTDKVKNRLNPTISKRKQIN